MSLNTRIFALDNKLGLLRRETEAWRAECADAGSRFALHASQIRAVCTDLDAMHDRIAEDIAAKSSGIDQAGLERQERRILTALQIWDSYRAKWSLRVEPTLARTLDAIDDLAWKAYEPALESAIRSGALPADRGKLPPLVFPSPRWSPFARPREQGYELDEGSGDWSVVDDFDDVLRCMPVPLIGIPWTQATHLAEAVFVGHETGHLVEEDLELQQALGEAVRTALAAAWIAAGLPSSAARSEAWSEHWRSEVFADLWGLLCCGPAYAGMLCEVLTDGAAKDETQPDALGQWSAYPPRSLRLAVLAEGLRAMTRPGAAFAALAAKIDEQVAAMPALPDSMRPYRGDVGPVVEALLGAPLRAFGIKGGARPAREVLGFNLAMHKQAETDAKRALAGQAVTASDVRVLFAGLALAFLQSPQGFRDQEVQARFAARLDEFRTQGVRSGSALRAVADPQTAAKSTADAVFRWLDRKRPP